MSRSDTTIKIDASVVDAISHGQNDTTRALLVVPERDDETNVVRTILRTGVGAMLEGIDVVRAGWRIVEPNDTPSHQEPAAHQTSPDSVPEMIRQTLVGALFESVDVTRSLVTAPVRTSLRLGALGIDTARAVTGSWLFAPVRKGTEPVTQRGRDATTQLAQRGETEEARSRRLFRQTLSRVVEDVAATLTDNPYVTRLIERQVDALLPKLADNPQVQSFVKEQVDTLLPQLVDDANVQAVIQGQVRKALPALAEDDAVQEFIDAKVDTLLLHISRDPQLHALIDAQLERLIGELTHDPRIQALIRAQANEYLQYLHDENSEVVQEIVQGQGIDLASDLLNEVRERTVSGDSLVESVVRSILRRPPRTELEPPSSAVQAQAVHLRRRGKRAQSDRPTTQSNTPNPDKES